MAALEFDCPDCGVHVVSMVGPHNPWRRCAGCQFLIDLPPHVSVEDRAELRRYMLERHIIGTGESA